MATYKTLEDLPVWREAKNLAVEIYRITSDSDFKRDFALRDQMRRSAISISSNIAEGFERASRKEFIQFLYIAKGSLGELRSQVAVAIELGYISPEISQELNSECLKLSREIYGFIQYLKKGVVR